MAVQFVAAKSGRMEQNKQSHTGRGDMILRIALCFAAVVWSSGPLAQVRCSPDGFGGQRCTNSDGSVTRMTPDGFGGSRITGPGSIFNRQGGSIFNQRQQLKQDCKLEGPFAIGSATIITVQSAYTEQQCSERNRHWRFLKHTECG